MTNSEEAYDHRSLRIWKYVTLVALFLASFSILGSVILYTRQQDQLDRQKRGQVLNCESNHRQDDSLSRLLIVTLAVGVDNKKVRKEFRKFVRQTQEAPKCPNLPKKEHNQDGK